MSVPSLTRSLTAFEIGRQTHRPETWRCWASTEGVEERRCRHPSLSRQDIYIYIYDLTRALKEVGGDTTRLFEVDILRRTNHDVSRDGGIYAALLRIAVLGWVDRLPDVPLVGTDEAAVGRADSPELVELPPRRFGVDLM